MGIPTDLLAPKAFPPSLGSVGDSEVQLSDAEERLLQLGDGGTEDAEAPVSAVDLHEAGVLAHTAAHERAFQAAEVAAAAAEGVSDEADVSGVSTQSRVPLGQSHLRHSNR